MNSGEQETTQTTRTGLEIHTCANPECDREVFGDPDQYCTGCHHEGRV